MGAPGVPAAPQEERATDTKGGARAQKSVFECWLNEEALAEMRKAAEKEMDASKDSFRLYTLCQNCREVSEQHGGTAVPPLED